MPIIANCSKTQTFFRRVIEDAEITKETSVVVVAHFVDSAIPFLPILNEYCSLRAVYAKPSSILPKIDQQLRSELPGVKVGTLVREEFNRNPAFFVEDVFDTSAEHEGMPVVLVDIGGYFAGKGVPGPRMIADALREKKYRLAGIVEDTQNGHKRYASLEAQDALRDCLVASVAHSPLKGPENHLVGVAVTFSIEAILRQSNVVLQSRRAGVIGYGPIGSGVARTLRGRGIPVRVCEIDPIRQAQAAAEGFHVHNYSDDFASFARDLNLIVSATGAGAHIDGTVSKVVEANFSEIANWVCPTREQQQSQFPLNSRTVRYLEPGCFVASVTSADDEIDSNSICQNYKALKVDNPNVTRMEFMAQNSCDPHYFFLMNKGNAVNFLHGGVVGPAIELLQGEIIACIGEVVHGQSGALVKETVDSPIYSLASARRRRVADMWLDQYLVENMR